MLLVALYLALNVVIIGVGCYEIARHPRPSPTGGEALIGPARQPAGS